MQTARREQRSTHRPWRTRLNAVFIVSMLTAFIIAAAAGAALVTQVSVNAADACGHVAREYISALVSIVEFTPPSAVAASWKQNAAGAQNSPLALRPSMVKIHSKSTRAAPKHDQNPLEIHSRCAQA